MTLVVIMTEYFTQIHVPVRAIVKASKTGAGTNLITGLAMGMKNRDHPKKRVHEQKAQLSRM